MSTTTFVLEDWYDYRSGKALANIERALLGTFLVFPTWLDEAALLEGNDFENTIRGVVFNTMRAFPKRKFDGLLLADTLEKNRVFCPTNLGWVPTLADLMNRYVLCDPVDVAAYVRIVKEAAALRRAGVTIRGRAA